jgi:hypothetical protein
MGLQGCSVVLAELACEFCRNLGWRSEAPDFCSFDTMM